MTQIIQPDTNSSISSHTFHDKEVDNDTFFAAMEEEFPLILSNLEIHQQTRLELQMLLADIKTKKNIQGTRIWTAGEQKAFFKTIKEEIINAGMAASIYIKEKIRPLIEDEILREINKGEMKGDFQDSDSTTLLLKMRESEGLVDTSFLFAKETTLISSDLRLLVNGTESIQEARKKLENYNGKYNALIFIGKHDIPIGVIRLDMLNIHENAGNLTLENIDFISGIFGYYNTSSEDLKKIMHKGSINILPIIDQEHGFLLGILTDTTVLKKEVQFYSTKSLTELSLDYLRMNA